MRPRELRIGHEDEKMQVSIKTVVKERGKFSITFNGLQWAYNREWCFMEKRSSLVDNIFNRYLRFFVVMTYSRFTRAQIGPVPILCVPRIIKFH